MQVWKFTLDVVGSQEIEMPESARLLSVQVQHSKPQLWVMVDETAESTELRKIRIAGTGRPIPDHDSVRFIDTIQLQGGALIFHVFERVA